MTRWCRFYPWFIASMMTASFLACFASYSCASGVVFATSSGGVRHTDQSGVIYQTDTGYSGGTRASTTAAIAGTSDDIQYQSERYDPPTK